MKVVFMGTPEFSVPSLEALINEFDVEAVITQPDRPKGRGKKITISPVKEIALKYNIPVYQPLRIKKDQEVIKTLKDIAPDFIVVVAFGQILSKEILDIPKYGCINLHASLLPKYRGAAPINWAIINGENVSGNTTMLMDVGLDTGDMLLKQEIKIEQKMTAEELHDSLMESGAELLVKTLKQMYNAEITPMKQPEECEFYASMLDKKTGNIDWDKNNFEIHNLIRGLNPWPVAYTYYKDNIMKIYDSIVNNKEHNSKPGTILDVSKEGIEVACGNGSIIISKIQFPGKKALLVSEFLKGNTIDKEELLSNKINNSEV